MLEHAQAEHRERVEPREFAGDRRRIDLVDDADRPGSDAAGEVDPREHGLEQREVGLQHQHHAGIAESASDVRHVLTRAESGDRHDADILDPDAVEQPIHFVRGSTGARETTPAPDSRRRSVLGDLEFDRHVRRSGDPRRDRRPFATKDAEIGVEQRRRGFRGHLQDLRSSDDHRSVPVPA